MRNPVHFGLCLAALPSSMSSEEYMERDQERIAILSGKIDSLWFVDHLQIDGRPLLEGWTTLT